MKWYCCRIDNNIPLKHEHILVIITDWYLLMTNQRTNLYTVMTVLLYTIKYVENNGNILIILTYIYLHNEIITLYSWDMSIYIYKMTLSETILHFVFDNNT